MTARPYNAKSKSGSIPGSTPKVKWGPKADPGKAPSRLKEEFPWLWSRDGRTVDFCGAWNDFHYTRAFQEEARARSKQQEMARR